VHATADGEFGPLTKAAVKRWQRRHDITPTGVVDEATWAALPTRVAVTACGQQAHGSGVVATCAHLRPGSTGPVVKVLQAAVDTDVTGEFGPATTAALTAFQNTAKLTGTGSTGPRTWAALGLAGTPACVAVPETEHDLAQQAVAEQVELLAAALLDRPDSTHNPTALAALHFARHQTGKPYEWGATGPDSYDCSGLTMKAYAHAGVTIPRVANDQYAAGRPVPLDHARAGDLMFYASDLTDPRSIYHVVMYVGDGTIIDAPQTGSTVGTRAMWTRNLLPVAVRPSATPPTPRLSPPKN
jgi:cell wall-associated NlpC family hydrolase